MYQPLSSSPEAPAPGPGPAVVAALGFAPQEQGTQCQLCQDLDSPTRGLAASIKCRTGRQLDWG